MPPVPLLREIVLDTETTGTDPRQGDRIVEIGCVELVNSVPTGRTLHHYFNPERPMSAGAFAVHGLADAFLADKPLFGDLAAEIASTFEGARLVIHNAAFDVAFLNAEFARLGSAAPPPIALADVVDTLALARRKHPGASNSLDALCARYGIDNSRRTRHGALLDAQILAEVYVELIGGKQADLGLVAVERGRFPAGGAITIPSAARRVPARSRLSDEERAAHAAFVATLGERAVWGDYLGRTLAG